jgi:hypothetical protein
MKQRMHAYHTQTTPKANGHERLAPYDVHALIAY